jgi:hypothetical protein
MFPFPATYTYEETVRRTVTVYDIYGDEIPAPPKGKRYVAFRPPLPKDDYLAVEGGRCLGPRLILGDAQKRWFVTIPLDDEMGIRLNDRSPRPHQFIWWEYIKDAKISFEEGPEGAATPQKGREA